MTIIVYRDGVMASDTGAWNGNASHSWARKLAQGPDGTLYGICGNYAEGIAYLGWVDGGCRGDEPKPRLLKDDDSSFWVMKVYNRLAPIQLISALGVERYEAPYFAIGSATECALGALFAGASAQQAVDAAREHGNGAGGVTRWISFKDRS